MLRRARHLVAAAHGAPALVVTLVTLALAITSGLGPARTVLATLVILLNQVSIGWSNDALDAVRDTADLRRDKPIARGDLDARLVGALAIGAAAAAIALSFALGPAAAAAHAVFLVSGWAYNAGLKRGVLATACYAVGFGALPLFVTLSSADPRPAAWWAIAMGALLGIAAHFANVLPDLQDDARHGIRALPHRWGERASSAVALVCLALAAALGAVGPGRPTVLSVGGAAAAIVLLALGVVLARRAPRSRALFRVILAAALVAILSLAGAGELIRG
jgi:4-hydroxybenzoate polyprenyltransferase